MNKPKLLGYSLQDLGFTLDKYSPSNGEVSGFDEITASGFQVPVEGVLAKIRPQIQSLLGAKNGEIINVIGTVNKHQIHFSQRQIRDVPTQDMAEKSFKELKKMGVWETKDFINANNLMDLAKDQQASTLDMEMTIKNGILYQVKTIAIPVNGGLNISFSTNRKL